MKKSNTASAAFDLDDLERELQKAVAPRQAAPADDPLAELARIVGQEAGVGSRRTAQTDSFEAFLAAADPGARTPAVEALFPEKPAKPALLDVPAMPAEPESPPSDAVYSAADEARAAPQPAPSAPVESSGRYVDPIEALLAQDLGLRSGLDDVPPPPMSRAPEPVVPLDEPLSAAPSPVGEPAAQAAADGRDEAAQFEPLPAEPGHVGDPGMPARATAPETPPIAADARRPEPFDDMLAEFERAMRDAAGDSVGASGQIAREPTPPPVDIILPAPSELGLPPPPPPPPPLAGVEAMAGAAVAAGAAAAARNRPRRGMLLAGGVIAVAVIGIGALALTGGGRSTRPIDGNVPVIEAKGGSAKERPANPGGVEVPNQDKEILQPRSAEAGRPERLAPREEQPLDLTEAQRQAAAAAAAPGAVRQIPGVGPAVPALPQGGAEPAPRPVASVPIILSGQPPVAPATPSPAPQPVIAAAPQAAAPVPTPAPQAPIPAVPPQAAAPTAAPAAPRGANSAAGPQPPAAAQTAAQPPTEPRRVRSVPIRPDNGEAAPQRAQPQPRVVPSAPQTAQPAAPNGPLNLSPQANRGAPPVAPSRQAAAPQGIVPSSVPSLSEPEPAAPESARQASSGGSFAVQLAAEGSEDAARAKFNRMRGQYGSVLGGASPSIRSAEVNGRNVYRVRVGNMSREEAVSMCERLKASGGSCFVARN
jgi:hypothetical protein